jgi:TPR repeat protein
MKILIYLLFACLPLSGLAEQSAHDLNEDGISRDPEEILKQVRLEAGQCNPTAQFRLGYEYYYKGQVVSKDLEQAIKWIRRAAEQDLSIAQYYLGYCYANGKGVSKDPEEAIKWFRRAAEQDFTIAQYDIGDCSINDEVVSYDLEEAIRWCRRAAEKGGTSAQYSLGIAYIYGVGVSKDPEEAVKWWRRAAKKGLAKAQRVLGVAYLLGEGVSKDPEEAVKWYRLAAEQGDTGAQCNLAYCYDSGKGVSNDPEEAVKWYRLAAEQDLAIAQYDLGCCYANGEGVSKDPEEAVKWWRLAAEQGLAAAQYNLARSYYGGEGVSYDLEEAIKWCRRAAEQGYARAQYALGHCYENGEGVSKDSEEAVKWYHHAAEQGFDEAQGHLGDLYYSGELVEKDLKEAVKWYRLAAEQGKANVMQTLARCYMEGKGVDKNIHEALKWYEYSAMNHDAFSNQIIHNFFNDTESQKRYNENDLDRKELFNSLSNAADRKEKYAYRLLGDCYATGYGTYVDIYRAIYWFKRAGNEAYYYSIFDLSYWRPYTNEYLQVELERCLAEKGSTIAQNSLGYYYYLGKGVRKDLEEAVKWWRRSAELGDSLAQCSLAKCYFNGEGVLEDSVEAYAWSIMAAVSGKEDAVKFKTFLRQQLNGQQKAAGQARARELQAMIEHKKQNGDLCEDKSPAIGNNPSGFGSGLLIEGGYVLTCWHVVESGNKVTISCGGKDYSASVVQKDQANDIAILRVNDAPTGAKLRCSDAKLGEKVFTMGFPHPDMQGLDVKYTTGTISGMTGPERTPVYYQISTPVQSGNSGGPLFDSEGNLVGMVAAKLNSLMALAATGDLPQNVNYAIKADYIIPLMKTVEGIKITEPSAEEANILSLIEDLKKTVVMVKVY